MDEKSVGKHYLMEPHYLHLKKIKHYTCIYIKEKSGLRSKSTFTNTKKVHVGKGWRQLFYGKL